MSEDELPMTDPQQARAISPEVQGLSDELRAAFAAWETRLRAELHARPASAGNRQARPPATAANQLRQELDTLAAQIEELRREVQAAERTAAEWHERAAIALRQGREDLAQHAILVGEQHRQAAAELRGELIAAEIALAEFRAEARSWNESQGIQRMPPNVSLELTGE